MSSKLEVCFVYTTCYQTVFDGKITSSCESSFGKLIWIHSWIQAIRPNPKKCQSQRTKDYIVKTRHHLNERRKLYKIWIRFFFLSSSLFLLQSFFPSCKLKWKDSVDCLIHKIIQWEWVSVHPCFPPVGPDPFNCKWKKLTSLLENNQRVSFPFQQSSSCLYFHCTWNLLL